MWRGALFCFRQWMLRCVRQTQSGCWRGECCAGHEAGRHGLGRPVKAERPRSPSGHSAWCPPENEETKRPDLVLNSLHVHLSSCGSSSVRRTRVWNWEKTLGCSRRWAKSIVVVSERMAARAKNIQRTHNVWLTLLLTDNPVFRPGTGNQTHTTRSSSRYNNTRV